MHLVYLSALVLAGAGQSWALYNIGHLEQVITYTRHHYAFKVMPLFFADGVPADERDGLHSLLHQQVTATQYIFTSAADQTIWNLLRNHIGVDALDLVLCPSADDAIWALVDKRLRKLRQTRMIVVLPDEPLERSLRTKRLEGIIGKLWELQFMKAIVLADGEIHTYKPYPKISIYKVSMYGNRGSADLFPAVQRDLMGYNISLPVENDIPRIFCITDNEGQLHVKGLAYQIFRSFMKVLNATLHISNLNAKRTITSSVNTSTMLARIGSKPGDLEVSIHPYTTMHETKGIVGYPLLKLRNCLIMPVHNEIERYMYLVRPFTLGSWLLIAVSVFYVGFIIIWLNPELQKIWPIHLRLSRGLLESLSQVLFLASLFRIYDPKPIYFFTYTLLAVLGFFITAWYSNLLSSFMTTFLVGEQVNTFEQLIQAQVKILPKWHEAKMLVWFVPDHLKEKVWELMVPVNASEQVAHLLSFNTSYAYPVTEERWMFLRLQQQYANKPVCRWSDICFGQPTIGYPMRLDSHLEHPMTEFIMNIQQAGLDYYYLTSDFEFALRAGYVRLFDNVLPLRPLDLDSFRVCWFILLCGWALSLAVFCAEYFECGKTAACRRMKRSVVS